MPNGVYPVPRTSPFLSLRVLISRDHLDHQLAEGADPTSSPKLALRARQLVQGRKQLAERIDDVLMRAHEGRPRFTAAVPLRTAAVLDCEEDLQALASRLRDDAPIDVQGAALTSRLLTDGASALYVEHAYSLRYAVRAARLALDMLGEPATRLQRAA